MSDGYAPSAKANSVADWIEVECLLQGHAVSAASLQVSAQVHGLREADIALGLRAMTRRAQLVGPGYPFAVAQGASARREAVASPWVAWLLMSPESPARQSVALGEAAQLHEWLTQLACADLYGPDSQALRFGWPSEDGRPREFPDAVRWLAGRMGVAPGGSFRPPRAKDGGVDVVVWRPFPDRRSGFPVLLVQCTIEKDYAHKAADVDTRVWSGWLALDVDPGTALAVPAVVPAGEEWNSLAARTVVLDRIRLTALMGARPLPEPLGTRVGEWAGSVLEAMRIER
jgi:hypothetical protein